MYQLEWIDNTVVVITDSKVRVSGNVLNPELYSFEIHAAIVTRRDEEPKIPWKELVRNRIQDPRSPNCFFRGAVFAVEADGFGKDGLIPSL